MIWEPLRDLEILLCVCKKKTIFMLLKHYLLFPLSFSHSGVFRRLCDIIILTANGCVLVYFYVLKNSKFLFLIQ